MAKKKAAPQKSTAKKSAAKKSAAKKSPPKKSASAKIASAKKAGKSKVKKPSSLSGRLKESLDKIVERVENLFSAKPKDIVSAIKTDHEGLRNFLKVLKDTDAEMGERKRAYTLFASLLKSHSQVEEKVVYETAFELTGRELHIKVAEGFVEHQVANDLMSRIESADDALEWGAHANVLSESVEHHLDEEEKDLLPLIRKGLTAKKDQELLEAYLALRENTQSVVTDKNAGVLEN